VFKGRGLEFEEVREYQPGDDIRTIDWNVTARMGRPFIKKFVEERELTVMLLLDLSASCRFGTVRQSKRRLGAEICALLALSASKNNDRVGMILFTDRVERYVPPRKGLRHILRIIRDALYFEPAGQGTNIALALDYLNRVSRRKTISFLISDFFDSRLEKPLSIAVKRHDLVALTLNDPAEESLKDTGIVQFVDPETGADFMIDSSDPGMREAYGRKAGERYVRRTALLRSARVDPVHLRTDRPYLPAMVRFFKTRGKKD
jgi:uncharacterized protein (DUF58 family)